MESILHPSVLDSTEPSPNTPTQLRGLHSVRTELVDTIESTLHHSVMGYTESELEKIVDTVESTLQHSVMDFTYSEALRSCFQNGNSLATQPHGLCIVRDLRSRLHPGVSISTKRHGHYRLNSMVLLTP
jgi:hypothetical protein